MALMLIGSILAAVPAFAEDFHWRDGSGRAVPDTESRKSSNGFAAWILTTSDPDWEAKWNTSAEEIPQFTEADSVRKGERVVTLIFIVNPSRSSDGRVNIRCDIRVTRPNGTVALDQRDLSCMEGVLQGDPLNLRLAGPTLPFVGEAGDPVGTWRIDIKVRDVGRKTSLSLRSSFDYVGDSKQAVAGGR